MTFILKFIVLDTYVKYKIFSSNRKPSKPDLKMSLQDFLDSRKEKPSATQTVVDIFSGNSEATADPIKSLSSWGSSLFDTVQSGMKEGVSKVTEQSKKAGQVVGVVNEDGDLSVPLLGGKETEEDPILKLLSKKQRILGFINIFR